MIRAFIAFKLPTPVLESLQGLQTDLKKAGLQLRWVPAQNIHLTLKFLGDITADVAENVAGAIRETAVLHPRLTLSAMGLGVFPTVKRARVVWAGIQGDLEGLKQLHRTLDDTLETIGFDAETRPFRGHLTLGRVKGRIDPRNLASAISELGSYASPVFEAGRLILFKSELRPSGAVYTEIGGGDLYGDR